jgi:hypothetical protein
MAACAVVGLVGCSVLAGCASESRAPSRAAAAVPPAPPSAVTATPLRRRAGTLKRRTLVRPRRLGVRALGDSHWRRTAGLSL